jgi:phospholipase/carboxylesterase
MAEQLDGPRRGPASGGPARQLVVLLHGLGADGADLIELANVWARGLPEAAFVAPNAPFPCDMAPYGRQWFSVQDRTPARILAGVGAALPLLDAFLDAELARLGLPPSALALTGFSQGAMMTLACGLRRRPALAALLAYSGRLAFPLPGDLSGAPPVLLVHGEADDVVPVAGSREAESALRAKGVAVQALYRPRLAHGIDDEGLMAGMAFLKTVFSQSAA